MNKVAGWEENSRPEVSTTHYGRQFRFDVMYDPRVDGAVAYYYELKQKPHRLNFLALLPESSSYKLLLLSAKAKNGYVIDLDSGENM